MIQIHIVTKSVKQANQLIQILIEKKLAINVFQLKGLASAALGPSGINYSTGNTMIIGQTKALLFNKIDAMIRKEFIEDLPLIYSLAIVNMDWEQTDMLLQETVKV